MTGRGDGDLGAWEGSTIAPLRQWNWNASFWPVGAEWSRNYNTIYSCNTILDYIENENFSEDFKNRMKGEAYALRGHAYYRLMSWFGAIPLHTTTLTTDLNLEKASIEETKTKIENDFLTAIPLLPVDQEKYGEITKGGAMGMLCKYYLNTKQWQK